MYAIGLRDQTEFTILDVIVDRAWEFEEVRQKNLAVMIANNLGKVLS